MQTQWKTSVALVHLDANGRAAHKVEAQALYVRQCAVAILELAGYNFRTVSRIQLDVCHANQLLDAAESIVAIQQSRLSRETADRGQVHLKLDAGLDLTTVQLFMQVF